MPEQSRANVTSAIFQYENDAGRSDREAQHRRVERDAETRRAGIPGLFLRHGGNPLPYQLIGFGVDQISREIWHASAGLGYHTMLREIGIQASVTLYTGRSAARGIIHRAGLGKLRRLETAYLWRQAAVAGKRLQARKVKGLEKPTDLFTKYLSSLDMRKHSEKLNISPEEGRSDAVPRT